MMNVLKPVLALCLAVLPLAASAQQSDFSYIGLHGGAVGGKLIDDTYGQLNGTFAGGKVETDSTPLAYGVDAFRMVKPSDDGIGFGFSLSGGAFTFETTAGTESFDSNYRYWGAGLLVGDITESSGGQKSTYFLGLEYIGLSVDIETSSSAAQGVVNWANSAMGATTGGLAIPFGFYSTFGEDSSISGGLGGRYFMGDPNGFYEIFLSVGVSF